MTLEQHQKTVADATGKPNKTIPDTNPEFVPSTSDQRVANNPLPSDGNKMRHEYRVLTDEEKRQMKHVKDTGLAFIEYVELLGTSRELSLAKTKIEEAVMWATKHITRDP